MHVLSIVTYFCFVLIHVSIILLLIHSVCNITLNSFKVYKSKGGEEISNINESRICFFPAGHPCTRQTGKLVYLETVCMIIFMAMTSVICE